MPAEKSEEKRREPSRDWIFLSRKNGRPFLLKTHTQEKSTKRRKTHLHHNEQQHLELLVIPKNS